MLSMYLFEKSGKIIFTEGYIYIIKNMMANNRPTSQLLFNNNKKQYVWTNSQVCRVENQNESSISKRVRMSTDDLVKRTER